jgi:hypothetical protein
MRIQNIFTDELIDSIGFQLPLLEQNYLYPDYQYGSSVSKCDKYRLSWETIDKNKFKFNLFRTDDSCFDYDTFFQGFVYCQEDIKTIIRLVIS